MDSARDTTRFESVCRYMAILLLSAVGIAYQVALMRILSIAQWHHFAYMIISIAMLGFGASGTALALARGRLRGHEVSCLQVAALLATVSLVVCHVLAQSVPFETLQLVTQPVQVWYLLLLYTILAIPFFLVATCITLAFFLAPDSVGRVYCFNMVGSGLGALGVVLLLYQFSPAALPAVLTFVAAAACVLLLLPDKRRTVAGAAVLAIYLAALPAWNGGTIRVSEYKGLSYALQFPDAEIVARTHSPLSELTAVRSETIRETPGQISNYPMRELGALPEQIGLYFDAGAVSPVHHFDGNLERFAWLDYVTGALPYRLVEEPRVVVLGAGGGTDVLAALVQGAGHVTAVEVEPMVFPMIREQIGDFAGGLYDRPDVTPVVAEGRGFLRANRDARYDVIVLPLFGSYNAAAAGVMALNESYLYTVEALELYLSRLTDDGVLALTSWLKTPPRDAIKLFATAVEACERAGFEDPSQHLAFVRSWNNATIVVSRRPLHERQIEAIRDFSTERFLDVDYYPGITRGEVNRYTILEEPTYHEAALAILSPERAAYYDEYLFHIRPATDDQPYFFRFLKWSSLPEMWRGMGATWVPFVEWGYVALVATIAQGILASVVLILLPVLALARGRSPPGSRLPTFGYFAAVGLAFMFLEIAFIQIFMQFLAYPVYAVAVVLTSFLVFSGLGSLYADGIAINAKGRTAVRAIGGIGGMLLVLALLIPVVFGAGAGWGDPAKIAVSIAMLAPLAFCMGIPFPSGLQLVARSPGPLLPWAFAINGCFSVVGASLATLTAVHLGFRFVALLSLALYVVAAVVIARVDGTTREDGEPQAMTT